MGKDPNSFEWPDISEFEEDNDTYNLVQIEYDTTWLSKSRQIAIYCSEGKRKIDSITFGCPGYYDSSY